MATSSTIIQGMEGREVGPRHLCSTDHPRASDRTFDWDLVRGKRDHVVLRRRVHDQQALAMLLQNGLQRRSSNSSRLTIISSGPWAN